MEKLSLDKVLTSVFLGLLLACSMAVADQREKGLRAATPAEGEQAQVAEASETTGLDKDRGTSESHGFYRGGWRGQGYYAGPGLFGQGYWNGRNGYYPYRNYSYYPYRSYIYYQYPYRSYSYYPYRNYSYYDNCFYRPQVYYDPCNYYYGSGASIDIDIDIY